MADDQAPETRSTIQRPADCTASTHHCQAFETHSETADQADCVHGKGEEERYEINPEQAETLAWMYSAYISGGGGPGIARELNRRGILNARGKPWNAKTVRDMLDTGFGAGLLRCVPVDADGNKITEAFPQMRWDVGAHPAIITEEEWEQYKQTRLKRGEQHPRRIVAR
ncbi:recombinase family protein [Saccharopolyspora pogona]|uniref:recombinase family protein n=1 Tax=Saccharopolyspora pogona TaxID=333966 RepID=UPI00168925DF|nr:recombinase family protein [Saccharopolyspora pogona]